MLCKIFLFKKMFAVLLVTAVVFLAFSGVSIAGQEQLVGRFVEQKDDGIGYCKEIDGSASAVAKSIVIGDFKNVKNAISVIIKDCPGSERDFKYRVANVLLVVGKVYDQVIFNQAIYILLTQDKYFIPASQPIDNNVILNYQLGQGGVGYGNRTMDLEIVNGGKIRIKKFSYLEKDVRSFKEFNELVSVDPELIAAKNKENSAGSASAAKKDEVLGANKNVGNSIVSRHNDSRDGESYSSSNFILDFFDLIKNLFLIVLLLGVFVFAIFSKKDAVDENPNAPICCPKCGSQNVTADTKGFGLGKAVIGNVVMGPLGLLGGLIGSKAVMLACLYCGNRWKAQRR